MKGKYDIIYEDDHLIAVNKYARVLSIPDRFDPAKPNLKDLLLRRYQNIFVVHRIDSETTGIVLFAKHKEAHQHLSKQFADRSVIKIYLAITKSPLEKKGTIDAYIAENEAKKGTYHTASKGKKAVTSYEVIEEFGSYALVRLQIFTGRTHQIRVHMRHIHAPLLVDAKYGMFSEFKLSQIKKIRIARDKEERPLIYRSSLHAAELDVIHPITNTSLHLTAPLHKDMKAVLHQLRKVYSHKSMTNYF